MDWFILSSPWRLPDAGAKGRFLLFEHPAAANSWINAMAIEAFRSLGAMIADFDFCKYGMTSSSPQGQGREKGKSNDQFIEISQEAPQGTTPKKS